MSQSSFNNKSYMNLIASDANTKIAVKMMKLNLTSVWGFCIKNNQSYRKRKAEKIKMIFVSQQEKEGNVCFWKKNVLLILL